MTRGQRRGGRYWSLRSPASQRVPHFDTATRTQDIKVSCYQREGRGATRLQIECDFDPTIRGVAKTQRAPKD